MSEKSNIEWTDATWNPVRGCVKVSPGCAHCYAETFAERFRGVQGHPYEQGFDLRLVPEKLTEPLSWKKPRRVFVNSMSDLFQDGVPDQFIVDVFGIMALAHWHTFQVLTKRPERMRSFLTAGDHGILRQFMLLQQNGGTSTRPVFRALDIKRRDDIEWRWPLPNVWLGVSVENQHFADDRIPLLLQTPAAVRFVSYEPALDYVNFRPWVNLLDWIIFGLESGLSARAGDADWGRDLLHACDGAKARPFIKQLGAQPFDSARTASGRSELLKLRDRKGGDMAEWPPDMRMREFPNLREG